MESSAMESSDAYEHEQEEEEQEEESSQNEEPEEEDVEEVLIEPEGYQTPTVQGAQVMAGYSKKIDEYVLEGQDAGFKTHMASHFTSWRNIVFFSFVMDNRNKSWRLYRIRNDFYELDKKLSK